MKINVNAEKLMQPNIGVAHNTSKSIKPTPFSQDKLYSIKVSVSKEGKDAYRKYVQEDKKTSYEELLETREKVMKLKGEMPGETAGILLDNQMNKIKGNNGGFNSLEDEGYALLEAYANAYNEIVKGHEDGTRNAYVEDKDSENGLRKLTMEEDLKALDDAFQKRAEYMEYSKPRTAEARKVIYQEQKRLAMIKGKRQEEYEEQAKETLEKIKKSENLPENMAEQMLAAKREMVKMFSQNHMLNFNSGGLRKSIKIFS